jgi:hypothetical protein
MEEKKSNGPAKKEVKKKSKKEEKREKEKEEFGFVEEDLVFSFCVILSPKKISSSKRS